MAQDERPRALARGGARALPSRQVLEVLIREPARRRRVRLLLIPPAALGRDHLAGPVRGRM